MAKMKIYELQEVYRKDIRILRKRFGEAFAGKIILM